MAAPVTGEFSELFERATDLRARKQYGEALECYVRLFEAAQPTPEAKLRSAIGALKCLPPLGRWAEAEAMARRAIDGFPAESQLHQHLGEALLRLGRRGEAEAALVRAIELDPEQREARVLLGILRKNLDQTVSKRRVRPWPSKSAAFDNLPKLLRRYLLDEARPRFIGTDTSFFAVGSCFAGNLARRLKTAGYRVHSEPIGEEVNSTYANRYLLEWVEKGPITRSGQIMQEGFGDATRARLRQGIENSDVVVITLGVAPCFFDQVSGEFTFAFHQSTTAGEALLNSSLMRTTTVAENVENLRQMLDTIERLSKKQPTVVLTVSPVPLGGTTEFDSAIIADSLSKSTLRLACHEVITTHPRAVYWPSFEIVRWLGAHIGGEYPPVFGAEDGNTRHVSNWLVDLICQQFVEHYGVGAGAEAAPAG